MISTPWRCISEQHWSLAQQRCFTEKGALVPVFCVLSSLFIFCGLALEDGRQGIAEGGSRQAGRCAGACHAERQKKSRNCKSSSSGHKEPFRPRTCRTGSEGKKRQRLAIT